MESIPENNPGNERVQDINKAREMAYAEKSYRDEIEQKTEAIDKKYAVNPDYELQGESLLEIAELNAKANAASDAAGKQYDIINKLQNGEELNEEESAHLRKIKDQPWAEDVRELNGQLGYIYERGALTGQEILDYSKKVPYSSLWRDLFYNTDYNVNKISWDILRKGGSIEQVKEARAERQHKEERHEALVDPRNPLHLDMRRVYEKIKKGQAEKVKKLREELKIKRKELEKFESTGIDEGLLKDYTLEIELICDRLDACEEYAREEAYQIAALYKIINDFRKEIDPIEYKLSEQIPNSIKSTLKRTTLRAALEEKEKWNIKQIE